MQNEIIEIVSGRHIKAVESETGYVPLSEAEVGWNRCVDFILRIVGARKA